MQLYRLENDNNSWLFHAKEMRGHSAHVAWVIRAFHMGGPADGQVWLKNPKTGKNIERHFVDEFNDWVSNMRELLERLRVSAIKEMRTDKSLNQIEVLNEPDRTEVRSQKAEVAPCISGRADADRSQN